MMGSGVRVTHAAPLFRSRQAHCVRWLREGGLTGRCAVALANPLGSNLVPLGPQAFALLYGLGLFSDLETDVSSTDSDTDVAAYGGTVYVKLPISDTGRFHAREPLMFTPIVTSPFQDRASHDRANHMTCLTSDRRATNSPNYLKTDTDGTGLRKSGEWRIVAEPERAG